SVDAVHASDTLLEVAPVECRLPGAVGGSVSPPVAGVTVSRSTLGPPFAVVAVARTVLEPATSAAVTVASAQVSQFPVPLNAFAAATTIPFTAMSIGRFVVLPLA